MNATTHIISPEIMNSGYVSIKADTIISTKMKKTPIAYSAVYTSPNPVIMKFSRIPIPTLFCFTVLVSVFLSSSISFEAFSG